MVNGLLSIKTRAAYGNMAIGVCLFALSVTRTLNPNSWLTLGIAFCLLFVASLALFASLSPSREAHDEMSATHDGLAAGHALRISLIAAGLMCAVIMAANITVDTAAMCLGLIGFSLLVYGAVFAWLER